MQKFPGVPLSERDSHKEIFKLINVELFGGSPNPIVHFTINKPIFARKIEDATLDRGIGFCEYFFKGMSINGIPKFPTNKYPSPHSALSIMPGFPSRCFPNILMPTTLMISSK
jgi:hypothetical protein